MLNLIHTKIEFKTTKKCKTDTDLLSICENYLCKKSNYNVIVILVELMKDVYLK